VQDSIRIEDFHWLDSNGKEINTNIVKQSGLFKILGICYQGGVRLVQTSDIPTSIISISPNPATNEIIIKCNFIEKGETRLSLYDLSGNFIKYIGNEKIETFGERSYSFSTKELSSGEYFIFLETPTTTENKKFIIQN
jgi:hypothetical protein